MKRFLGAVFLLFASALLCLPRTVSAQSVTILHSFQDGTVTDDGKNPNAGLIQGTDGNFYGTATFGGSTGAGVVYEITSTGQVTILHSFRDGSVVNDGLDPLAGLVEGMDSDFYGTTAGGGSAGEGMIFQMTPAGQVTVLHSFGDHSVPRDGKVPYSGLIQASNGDFYGTTPGGGSANHGAIFKMTSSGQVTSLHSFLSGKVPNDGSNPMAGLVQGSNGDFYGTTSEGGSTISTDPSHQGYGTVFSMTPTGAVTILHSFGDGSVPNDGKYPQAGLTIGADGNFYGTTSGGGSTGLGAVFRITPGGQVTLLHSFGDGSVVNDGAAPSVGLFEGADGNFYGTTMTGGSASDGTIFAITPLGQVTILHSFNDGSVANDGKFPFAGVIQAKDSTFYGTTESGGSASDGTVFNVTVPMLTIKPLSITGGRKAMGTLELLVPVVTKTVVHLTSSDPGSASAPSTVTILAGHSSVSFTITTEAVATPTGVTITVQLPSGDISGSFVIVPPKLTTTHLNPNPVVGGNSSTATVSLNGPAPAGGETIDLSTASNPTGAVTGFWSGPPGQAGSVKITSVAVPTGATSATFVIATKAVSSTVKVTILATLNGVTLRPALSITP